MKGSAVRLAYHDGKDNGYFDEDEDVHAVPDQQQSRDGGRLRDGGKEEPDTNRALQRVA